MMAALFIFSNLSSFSFWFFVCRFSWGAFFKNWVSVRTRPGADVSVCFGALLFVFSKCVSFPCYLLSFGVECVMDANGYWNLNFEFVLFMWFLFTSMRQPIHGPHPLIGRSSTSSTGFYFIPYILDVSGSNPLSNIPSDDGCAAVRERLLLPPITTWWVPADYVGLVIGIVNIVNYSAESNQTNSIAFCLNFCYQRILKRELILHYSRY